MSSSPPTDPIDTIAAALVRLRGRGGPRGWMPPGMPSHGRHEHPGHDDQHDEIGEGERFRGGRGRRGGPDFGGPGGWGPWMGPHGATRISGPARMRVLEVLAASDHPLTVSELGEQIGVDQPRASRLVQQGAQMGLVRREADPDDARRTRIVLTEQGSRLVRGFRDQRRGAITTALAAFTDAERAELARLLVKLADAWPR